MCEVRSFETCNLTPVLPFPLKQNLLYSGKLSREKTFVNFAV